MKRCGNGFVTQIDLLDTFNVLHTVFTGVDPSLPGTPVDFVVNFATTPYLVQGVKIYVNINHNLNTWEEIDAVELRGVTGLAPVTTTINTFNGGLPGGIERAENLVLSGVGNVTADDPTHFLTNPTTVHTFTIVADDISSRRPDHPAHRCHHRPRADSRLSFWKPISGPGGFTKEGARQAGAGRHQHLHRRYHRQRGHAQPAEAPRPWAAPTSPRCRALTVTGSTGTFTLTFHARRADHASPCRSTPPPCRCKPPSTTCARSAASAAASR